MCVCVCVCVCGVSVTTVLGIGNVAFEVRLYDTEQYIRRTSCTQSIRTGPELLLRYLTSIAEA